MKVCPVGAIPRIRAEVPLLLLDDMPELRVGTRHIGRGHIGRGIIAQGGRSSVSGIDILAATADVAVSICGAHLGRLSMLIAPPAAVCGGQVPMVMEARWEAVVGSNAGNSKARGWRWCLSWRGRVGCGAGRGGQRARGDGDRLAKLVRR